MHDIIYQHIKKHNIKVHYENTTFKGKTFQLCLANIQNLVLVSMMSLFSTTGWIGATAGGDIFPRGYHKPSSQHCLC